jgi:ATP-dependent DNA helicase RecG
LEIFSSIPKKESVTAEFKTSFNEEVVESLVAFSNAKGGIVYVGVSDNGKIHGITIGKETIQSWINEIKNKTSPQIIPDAETLVFEKKSIVALFVPEYPVKPVSVRGKYFKRIGNSNHLLSVDEIANEHLKTINSSWDFYIDPNHSETDLSKKKIAKFVSKIKHNGGIKQVKLSDAEILNKMEILRNGKITFGSYLLFVKDYCSISDVQIGRFKSHITIIDSISLNSDLFQEVEDTIAFIKKHLKIEYIITGKPQRSERFDYPLDAIREIVVNMIVHRDYRDSSASVIKIFDNRIEFYNPGKLYGGITVQDLLSGNYASKSRNKLIAGAFKEAGIIERYGSGIMRVRKICKDYGIKEPDFSEIFNGFQVILYNEKIDVTDNVTDVTDNVTDVTDVTDRTKKILEIIVEDNQITISEIAKRMKVTKRTILRDIEKLKNDNLLERIGSEKGGYWKMKIEPMA